MTDSNQTPIYISVKNDLPEDENQLVSLQCSDDIERQGYPTYWADGRFAGWLVDGLKDFVNETGFEYEIIGWRKA